jgi:hypothetical protein
MDLTEIAAGIGIVKTGFDAIRTALGLVKDVQGALPAGEKKEAAARALEEAEKQIRLGEAQIAKALGYPLCRCAFPPTPMLAVGYRRYVDEGEYHLLLALVAKGEASSPSGFTIHECPTCGANDAGPYNYVRMTPSPPDLPTDYSSGNRYRDHEESCKQQR